MMMTAQDFMAMSTDQLADRMMAKYPHVNPAPMLAPAQVQTPQTDAMDMLPAAGEHQMGPNGPMGAALPAAGGLMNMATGMLGQGQGHPAPPVPMMPLGRGGQPAPHPTVPVAAPMRARSMSLGDILGGLK